MSEQQQVPGTEAKPDEFPGARIRELVEQMEDIQSDIRDLQKDKREIRKKIKDYGVQLGPLDVALKLRKLQEDNADIAKWQEDFDRLIETLLEAPQEQLPLGEANGNDAD